METSESNPLLSLAYARLKNAFLRKDIFKKANYIRSKLYKKNISYIDSESHIIPVLIGSADSSKEVSKKLMEDYNIYVQPIF